MSLSLSRYGDIMKLYLSLYSKEDTEYDNCLGYSSKRDTLSFSVLEMGHGSGMLLSWYGLGYFNDSNRLSTYSDDNSVRYRVNENGDIEKRPSNCLSCKSDEWGSYFDARDKQITNKIKGERNAERNAI